MVKLFKKKKVGGFSHHSYFEFKISTVSTRRELGICNENMSYWNEWEIIGGSMANDSGLWVKVARKRSAVWQVTSVFRPHHPQQLLPSSVAPATTFWWEASYGLTRLLLSFNKTVPKCLQTWRQPAPFPEHTTALFPELTHIQPFPPVQRHLFCPTFQNAPSRCMQPMYHMQWLQLLLAWLTGAKVSQIFWSLRCKGEVNEALRPNSTHIK